MVSYCGFCGIHFYKPEDRNNHELKEHIKPMLREPYIHTCQFCGIKFGGSTGKLEHIRLDHPEEYNKMADKKEWKCYFCEISFTHPEGRYYHMCNCHNEQYVKYKDKMAQSTATSEVKDKWICPWCQTTFDSKDARTLHMGALHATEALAHYNVKKDIEKNTMKLPKLEEKFIVPKQSKTLKLQPRHEQSLGSLVESAEEHLWSQEEFNRIEFRYNKTYVVVAKLKDRED